MRPDALIEADDRLEAFAEAVLASLPRADQRRRGVAYLRGLLLGGPKTMRAMADRLVSLEHRRALVRHHEPGGDGYAATGCTVVETPPALAQALQRFVSESPWTWTPVRRHLTELLDHAADPVGRTTERTASCWVIGEHAFPKRGDHSPGVSHQYSWALGRVGNCQIGVSARTAVGTTVGHGSVPRTWRLLLPPDWDDVPRRQVRRRRARVPTGLGHRPAWRLALDAIDELRGWSAPGDVRRTPPVLVRPPYGEVPAFLAAMEQRGLDYLARVGEGAAVLADTGRAEPVRRATGAARADGRSGSTAYPSARALVSTVSAGRCTATPGGRRWLHDTRRQARLRFLAVPVRRVGAVHACERVGPAVPRDHPEARVRRDPPRRWLIAHWPDGSATPAGYWVSNLGPPSDRADAITGRRLADLVVWDRQVRCDDCELQDLLGLDRYEGRSFVGWHHHVTLVSAAQGFLAMERQRSTCPPPPGKRMVTRRPPIRPSPSISVRDHRI